MAPYFLTLALYAGLLWGSEMKTYNYFYSPTTNAFYPSDLRERYESAGAWPVNAIGVEDSVFSIFTGKPPVGKVRGALNGNPAWLDIPELTAEQITAAANSRKAQLISEATQVIAPMKDASDGGYIDDVDKPKLVEWQKYRYALTKVDTTNPVWPEQPTE